MVLCSRFQPPSGALVLRSLIGRTKRAVWVGMVLAVASHALLTQLKGWSEERRAAKPLTTRFVKRRPRLSKPLELKKRVRPKRRLMRREMVAVRVKASGQQLATRIPTGGTIQSLAKPCATLSRSVGLGRPEADPETLAGAIVGMKDSKDMANLSVELVDVNALDTGEYQAIVIQDPTDRRSMRGFFHLFPVYIRSAAGAQSSYDWGERSFYPFPGSIRNLVLAMNKYTDIRTDVGKVLSLDSPGVCKVPIIFLSYHFPFHISPAEAHSVGKYLITGGFLFSDTLLHSARAVYQSFRTLWRQSLPTVGMVYGVHWDFQKIPNGHGIYHCYFDFDGPPAGWDNISPKMPVADYLEGVFIEERLLGVCTSKNYWGPWSDKPAGRNPRALQFAVNVIVFALTQEGSITHRLMESVR